MHPRLAQLEGGTFERWGMWSTGYAPVQKGNKCLDLPPSSFWLSIQEVSGFVLLCASALSSHCDAWPCFRPKEGDQIIKVFWLPVTSKLNKLYLRSLKITLKEKRQRIAKFHSKPVTTVGWSRVH